MFLKILNFLLCLWTLPQPMVFMSPMLTASGWLTPATQRGSTHCRESSSGEGLMFTAFPQSEASTVQWVTNENPLFHWEHEPVSWGLLTWAGLVGTLCTRLLVTSSRYFDLSFFYQVHNPLKGILKADNILSHMRKLIHEASTSSSNVTLLENSSVTHIDRWSW